MPDLRTLVIGDVHGHIDRLRALLEQAGVIDADGERIGSYFRVVQLGDLGNYASTSDPAGDLACWVAAKRWLDIVLWGNHDRALRDPGHRFAGYTPPDSETLEALAQMRRAKRVRLAASYHGHLLTHAGLHPAFEDQLPPRVEQAAAWLNNAAGLAVVNAISYARGGRRQFGGILWRDYEEPLSTRWPQVFGHTRGDTVRAVGESWCIDVGSRDNGRLAAIWLPDLTVVEVDLAAGADATPVAGRSGPAASQGATP